MGSSHEELRERERQWSTEVLAKERKLTNLITISIIPGSILVLSGIGLLTGGIEGAISNILIGLILGIVIMLFFFIVRPPINYGKRYLKRLEEAMGRDLKSPGEREAFAAQMLSKDGSGTVECLDYKEEQKDKRLWISRDYVLSTDPMSGAHIIRLRDVTKMESDVMKMSIRSGTVRTNLEYYTILFYYHKIAEGKKEKHDTWVAFASPQFRDKVLKIIQEK